MQDYLRGAGWAPARRGALSRDGERLRGANRRCSTCWSSSRPSTASRAAAICCAGSGLRVGRRALLPSRLIVRLLAAGEPGLDVARAVEIALVHDVAELRIGDLPRTGARYFPRGPSTRPNGSPRRTSGARRRRAVGRLRGVRGGREPRGALRARLRQAAADDQVSVYEAWGQAGLAEFWRNPETSRTSSSRPSPATFARLRERFAPRRPRPASRLAPVDPTPRRARVRRTRW